MRSGVDPTPGWQDQLCEVSSPLEVSKWSWKQVGKLEAKVLGSFETFSALLILVVMSSLDNFLPH